MAGSQFALSASVHLAPCAVLSFRTALQIFRVKPAKGGSIQDLRDAAIAKGLFPAIPASTAPAPTPPPGPAPAAAASEREGALLQELAAKDAENAELAAGLAEKDEELARLKELLAAASGDGK